MDTLQLLICPFAACAIIALLHCYMGIHVVRREVIFVDLALAQIAALGISVAILFGYEAVSSQSFIFSIIFTLLGAVLFALSRFRKEAVPQEAIIGIVYAVSSALSVLVLDRAPHGLEEMKAMLVGNILFVTGKDIFWLAVLYIIIAVFCILFHSKFMLISKDVSNAKAAGVSVRWWDFIFYILFGLMVTKSVRLAGILLVFSYLIIPAVCSILYVGRQRERLIFGWAIAFLASILGLFFSAMFDLPTGASIVGAFGLVLIASITLRPLIIKD
ncbi:MAG: metal ABC transporter permease [Candidatus Omnitrophica bacterium]|nr:metal ABC transporter permease [Candidatus Omnitrophota bacterium]